MTCGAIQDATQAFIEEEPNQSIKQLLLMLEQRIEQDMYD